MLEFTWGVLTDRWVEEFDLGSSYKGYTGYREELGGKDDIGGPNQATSGQCPLFLPFFFCRIASLTLIF